MPSLRPSAADFFSLPYPERAACALLEVAMNAGPHVTCVLPWEVPRRPTRFGRVDAMTGKSAVDVELTVRRVSKLSDLLRVIGNASRSRFLSLSAMHLSKVLFDRKASELAYQSEQGVFGMPGACLSIFTASGRVRKTFHAVDAHPRAHNDALIAHYGRLRAAAEIYPAWLVNRIEHELELATTILAPSEIVRDQMIRGGVMRGKVIVQPYGVDYSMFRPVEPRSSHMDHSPSRRVQIVYVGQVSLRKGIPFLVEAVRGLRVDLTIVGNVFDRRTVTNLPDNVKLIGQVRQTELRSFYSAADAFALPTLEDACPLVALEAVATGVPLITTYAAGAKEIVPHALTTCIRSGDVRGLRDAISEVRPLTREARQGNAIAVRSSGIRSWGEYATETIHALSS